MFKLGDTLLECLLEAFRELERDLLVLRDRGARRSHAPATLQARRRLLEGIFANLDHTARMVLSTAARSDEWHPSPQVVEALRTVQTRVGRILYELAPGDDLDRGTSPLVEQAKKHYEAKQQLGQLMASIQHRQDGAVLTAARAESPQGPDAIASVILVTAFLLDRAREVLEKLKR